MKLFLIKIVLLFGCIGLSAQQEFHVLPNVTNGNGTIERPWDLQTALNQLPEVVNGGDTIFLHEGQYNGRFVSLLKSTNSKNIMVTAYKKDKVVLNGNVSSDKSAVLEVKGQKVTFKDLEITFIGNFSRIAIKPDFKRVDGISHTSGIDCQFINLKIHNHPGSGFGSWKQTGGSLIYGCIIFNNGYFSAKRGSGVGLYIQNASDATRQIKNNIIFNNYYKGVEIWSAKRNAKVEYIKNINFENNVVFNNGLPAGKFKDNLILATDDRNGINIAKNITINNNVFYHNTIIKKSQVNGDAATLTIGFNEKSPVENVSITNNVIIGRNNGLRLMHAKSLNFQNNVVYCGYVHLKSSVLEHIDDWTLSNNSYYTKNGTPFRIIKHRDYKLNDWKTNFGFDTHSTWQHLSKFRTNEVLSISRNAYDKNNFKIALFSKDERSVSVDVSDYNIAENTTYTVKDIATNEVLASGKLNASNTIDVSIGKHNETNANFGVFALEFQEEIENKKEKNGFFKRFFKWLF